MAAKQQIRRLCTLKKKRKALNPPDWLVEAYNKRDKTELAQMLVDANFDKDWVFVSCWETERDAHFLTETLLLGSHYIHIYIYICVCAWESVLISGMFLQAETFSTHTHTSVRTNSWLA